MGYWQKRSVMRTLKLFFALLIAVFVVTSCQLVATKKVLKKDQAKETVKKDDDKKKDDKKKDEKKDVAKKDEKKDEAGKEKKDVKIVPSKNDVAMDVGSGSSVGASSGGSQKNKVSTNIVLESKDIPESFIEQFAEVENFAKRIVTKYEGQYLLSRLILSTEKDKKISIQTFFVLSGDFPVIIDKMNLINNDLKTQLPNRRILQKCGFSESVPLNSLLVLIPDTITTVKEETGYYTTKRWLKFKDSDFNQALSDPDDPYVYTNFSEIVSDNLETVKWLTIRKVIYTNEQKALSNVILPLEMEKEDYQARDEGLDSLLIKYIDKGILRFQTKNTSGTVNYDKKGKLSIGNLVFGGKMNPSPTSVLLSFMIESDKKVNKKKK